MSTTSPGALLTAASERLRLAGVESPRREARLLLAYALGVRQEDLVSKQIAQPGADALVRFETALARRVAREPLAYILGLREFWSLDFAVGPDVLVPRPESEVLIEEALRRFPVRDAPLRVLDLGTGSACLLLAFLSERPRAQGVGADISQAALAVAAQNAAALGLEKRTRFVRSNWTKKISGAFDAIFINPPYIADGELSRLEPEVARYEPRSALEGGADGLAAYRAIAGSLRRHLSPEGLVFLEIGEGQAQSVAELLAQTRLSIDGTVYDLAGIPRCLVVGLRQEKFRQKRIGNRGAKRLGFAPLGKTKGRPPRSGGAGGSAEKAPPLRDVRARKNAQTTRMGDVARTRA
jgi:release factor glutamine methyltransferase